MTSVAERKRRKRTIVLKGGPKRAGVKRYASGRIINRDKKPVETDDEIVATVKRQPHRLPLAGVLSAAKWQSEETLMGSSIGRLFWQGIIQRHQYDAGIRYAQNMARDRATIGLPPCTTQAIMYGDKRGGGFDVSSNEAREATERMNALRVILLACGDECRGDIVRPGIVVRQVALEDREDSTLSEHEIGALRLALNALARHYKIEANRRHRVAA